MWNCDAACLAGQCEKRLGTAHKGAAPHLKMPRSIRAKLKHDMIAGMNHRAVYLASRAR